MNNDLISRKALLKALHNIGGCDAPPDTWAAGYDSGIDAAYDLTKTAPAVDAAPVVRCKYCQHSSCAYDGAQRYCRRHYGERRAVEDMGFCSDGERE